MQLRLLRCMNRRPLLRHPRQSVALELPTLALRDRQARHSPWDMQIGGDLFHLGREVPWRRSRRRRLLRGHLLSLNKHSCN